MGATTDKGLAWLIEPLFELVQCLVFTIATMQFFEDLFFQHYWDHELTLSSRVVRVFKESPEQTVE